MRTGRGLFKATDEQILEALAASPSVTAAAERLGIRRKSLVLRCEKSSRLFKVYIARVNASPPGPRHRHSDEVIFKTLLRAKSVRGASSSLGMSNSSIYRRCERNQFMRWALEAATARGRELLGQNREPILRGVLVATSPRARRIIALERKP